MPGKRIILGDYMPDLPPWENPGLVLAQNAIPASMGYKPLSSWQDLGYGAIAKYPRGGIAVIDKAGTPHNFVGTEDKLYQLGAEGWVDVSKVNYGAGGVSRWEMAQFGDDVIAVQPNYVPQYRALAEIGGTFDDLDASAPKAAHIGVVRRHVVLGNLFDAIYGSVPDSVWWSAIDNPFSWPTPGSDTAQAVQSDRQPLRGNGGWVQAVVSGSEVGAIFQERSIWRMDYVGGDIMYQLTRVESERGCLYPGLAVAFGREIFYLNEDGFYRFDYTNSKGIGKERINSTFFADLDVDYSDRIQFVKDPDRTVIYVLYPGSGNTSGRPNKLIIYDWELDRFSSGAIELELLLPVLSPYSETVDYPFPGEDIDPSPEDYVTYDERIASSGAFAMGGFDSTLKIGKLDGDPLIATFETGVLELSPGRHARTEAARPIVTGTDRVFLETAAAQRVNGTLVYGRKQQLGRNGWCGTRKDGSHHQFRMTVGRVGMTGFDEALGMDLAFVPSGKR